MSIKIYDAFGTPKTIEVAARRGLSSFNHISGANSLDNWAVAGVVNATAFGTASIVAATLYAMPFASPRGGIIDQMTINVTSAGAGSSTRVGLYKSIAKGTNLYPGALVTDAGVVTTASTGVKTYTTGFPIILDPGELYWFACVCNTTAPVIRGLAVAGCYPIFGIGAAMSTAPGLGVSVAYTFGTLPTTFKPGGTLITAAPLPAIACRYKA